jgi:hypothetical protein
LGDICYELEGDGPLIFETYQLYLRGVNLLRDDARLPQRVLDAIVGFATTENGLDDDLHRQLSEFCRGIIAPARAYLAEQATKDIVIRSIHLAKLAAMWNPLKVHGMTLNEAMLRVHL